MNIQSEYKKPGIYISDVTAEDGRIHLKRLVKIGDGQYAYQDEDTIVCNEKVDKDPFEGLGWYASQDKGRVYFVQTDGEIKASSVKTEVQRHFLMKIPVRWSCLADRIILRIRILFSMLMAVEDTWEPLKISVKQ